MKLHAILILVFMLAIHVTSQADTITHCGNGPFGDVSTLLNSVGIGNNNCAAETTAETFAVPGSSGNIDLIFTFKRDTGSFKFSFGYFDISDVTASPIDQKKGWAIEAISKANLVFDDRLHNPSATAMRTIPAGSVLAFFLIPNNTADFFLSNPDLFFPSQTANDPLRSPLFSVSDANPGKLDQMLSFIGNEFTLFTFEDLTRAGPSDWDFTDLAFTVNRILLPEPSALLFLLMVLPAMVIIRRRKRAKAICHSLLVSVFLSLLLVPMLISNEAFAMPLSGYSESWDVDADVAGWRKNTIVTTVSVVETGGNPGGYLLSEGTGFATFDIGAVTDLPQVIGNYDGAVWTALFDLQLISGEFDNLWLRFQANIVGASNGWLKPLTTTIPCGMRWRSFSVSFDPAWTDSEAMAAGWVTAQAISPTAEPSASWSDTLGAVSAVEIRISGEGPLQAGIDNFMLVPEPDSILLLMIGLATLRLGRHKVFRSLHRTKN